MTPEFTISKSKVLHQFNLVKDLSDIVSYSSKTNPIVTSILEDATDCLFSVHLNTELKNIKNLSRVVFLAQGWDKQQVCDLIKKNIRWFVVENLEDLRVLNEYLDENPVKVNLLLRLRLKENTIKTEKYYVFGMYSKDIKREIEKMRPKVNKIGIHFHRKSQNLSEWNLKFELENTFSEDFLKSLDIICIGGGLPSVYANTNINIFDSIFKKIRELKAWLNRMGIKLMIEPGRFIAAPAGKLITKIIAIHENTIIVDASVYNSDLDALIIPVKLLVEGERKKGRKYTIKGITPCSLDLFRYRVYLKEKKVGDKIVFINAGAYNFSSDFCDLQPIKTRIIE